MKPSHASQDTFQTFSRTRRRLCPPSILDKQIRRLSKGHCFAPRVEMNSKERPFVYLRNHLRLWMPEPCELLHHADALGKVINSFKKFALSLDAGLTKSR